MHDTDTHMELAMAWVVRTFKPDDECPIYVTYLERDDHVMVFTEDLDGYRFATRFDDDGMHDLGESYAEDGSDIDTEE